jgi:hypothetical protein
MRRAVGSGLTTAIILVAMLTGASAAAAKTHARTHAQGGLGVLIPKTKSERLPSHGGTADSLNWSGYAVTPAGGGITAVSSTFTVPSAGLAPAGFARYLDRDRRVQHQRPDPGRCLGGLGTEQSAARRSVLRVV